MPYRRLLAPAFAFALLVPVVTRAADPFRFPEGTHGRGVLKYVGPLPVLTAAGTPEEVGTQVGVLTKPAAEGLVGYLNGLITRARLDPLRPWLVRTTRSMLSRFPPDHLTEAEATIKASGLDRDLILLGNVLWDIKKLGCSTLYVGPDRSATGAPLMGRNFDFPTLGALHEYSLATVYRPAGKRAFVSVGFPGLIGCVSAMNDAGLCLAVLDVQKTADGSPPFDLSGTPLPLTFRRIMEECATVAEAEKVLRAAKRTTLLNLAVCDTKDGAVFEMTPKTLAVRRPQDGLCPCTNHFRSPDLVADTRCERYEALDQGRAIAKLGVTEIQARLHAAHQGEATLQTMVFEPAKLTLYLALGEGPTTARPLQKLELGPLFGAKK
jgi:isopenicillin-N N-acyltransferase like protein